MFALVGLLFTTGPPTHAATVDISGTFEGTASTFESGCLLPPTTSSDVSQILLELTQSGLGFTGKTTANIGEPDTFALTFSGGSVDAAGNFTGTLAGTNTGGGVETFSVAGSVSGDTMTVSGTGAEVGGAGCTLETFSATLGRTSGGAITNPATATSQAVVNNPESLSTAVDAVVTSVQSRIGSALRGGGGPRIVTTGWKRWFAEGGISAGDDAASKGVWASYGYTEFENDFVRTQYDGSSHLGLAGMDFSPWQDIIVGGFLGYETTNVDTVFNGGGLDADGYTVGVYVGALLGGSWTADASAGYSGIDTAVNRSGGGTKITGGTDTTRTFAATNLYGQRAWKKWLLTGRAGYLYARNRDDVFTESNGRAVSSRRTRVVQVKLGGEAAYTVGSIEPYAHGTYSLDISRTDVVLTPGLQPSNDEDDFVLGAGFRYFGRGLTGQARISTRLGRDDIDEVSADASVRWDF